MIRFLLCLAAIAPTFNCFSQTIPLIHAGEVINSGKVLYDSGKYAGAIEKYLTVPKRDTAYVFMLSELALAYVANKQYDKALTVCEEGLQSRSIYRAHFLRTQAIATDRGGDYNKSVTLFQKAIAAYPFDFSLIFNLGITYYNHKAYDSATTCFFKVISIYPFHSASHLNLARLSAGQGRKTHAMLSFGMYLSINNEDNQSLILLDHVLNNEFVEEGSIAATGPNAFEKLDQIIRAKIALDKDFKSKIDFNVATVRQFQLFFDQLGTADLQVDDPWRNYYNSIYKTIKEKDLIEPFIYHIVKSSGNEAVTKWTKKNEKRMNQFFGETNTAMKEKRNTLTFPEVGISKPTPAWYDNDNKLESIGVKDAKGVSQGKWIFFHDNGERMAEGTFDVAGKKVGTWTYGKSEGTVSSVENYDTGEVRVFNDGTLSQHFYLKDDKTQGDAELYNTCGILSEKLNFVQGKRQGTAQAFYASGKLKQTSKYEGGKLSGEFVSYYESGVVKSKVVYKDNLLDGPYTEYHANGKVSDIGAYVADKPTGVWKYYYANGRLERTGTFINGQASGEWLYYDPRGSHTETRNFKAGDFEGDNTFYYNGKVYYIKTFKDDVLIRIVYFDVFGKEIGRFGNTSGTFAAKGYYPYGQLASEGAYKKGEADGNWKYYYPEGNKRSEFTYVNGREEGEAKEYFRSGRKKFDSHYKEGSLDGYFIEYYPHGKIKQQGWFQDGNRQQQWLNYYVDGTVESEYYYLNGDPVSEARDFTVNGKVSLSSTYTAGRITDVRNFNSEGEAITKKSQKENEIIYETKYGSGKHQSKIIAVCGEYIKVEKSFPNGKPYYAFDLLSGKKEGPYKHFALNGQVLRQGHYRENLQEGIWEGFNENGTPDSKGSYLQGETDSTWVYYYENGKIASTAEYAEDERHGVTRIFSPEETPLLEKLYYSGNLMAYRVIDVAGKFGTWIPFAGNANFTIPYANGTTAYEETYSNGSVEGPKRVYYSNGTTFSEYMYVLGDYHGDFRINYPNGKPMQKGSYKFDELHGKYELYNEDGSLSSVEQYIYGSREGKATLFLKGGKPVEFNFYGGITYE